MNKLSEKSIALLKGKNFAYIATLNSDGSPQVTPVWADTDGKNVVVNTAMGRAKERNLTRDPRVAVAIHDMDNPYHRVSLDGKVINRIAGKQADDHIDSLSYRFTGNKSYQGRTVTEKRVILVIEPTRIREQ
ncbi:MAG: PPOX class F420-dependent oxidoreductase [Thaumarchaeota archaeon]|nr:PPOX class F420-dependent oxidoreductase [Nitrososphaerota archaeon]